MSKKYRTAIVSRTPFVKRRPVKHQRVPVKRHAIYSRKSISSKSLKYDGCSLCSLSGMKCAAQTEYCEWDAKPEEYDFQVFRLLTVTHVLSPEETQDLIEKINFVKANGCYIRLVTDVPVDKEVLFALGYEPLNVVQFNLNLLGEDREFTKRMKQAITTADNCGLYVGLMLYPVIPCVTKCFEVIEMLNSLRCSCNIVCFKYLELPADWKPTKGYFDVNGYAVPSGYFMDFNNKWIVNNYYRRTFSTVVTRFLSPRKVNCLCCSEHVCY